MGADIHYAIEARDGTGRWHTLYLSDLFYTEWWTSRFPRNTPVSDLLDGPTWRHYALFGVLSAVRGENPLAPTLGNDDGVLLRGMGPDEEPETYALPADASPIARDRMGEDSADCHSQGWLLRRDLDAMAALLDLGHSRWADHPQEAALLRAWIRQICTIMDLLAGKDGTPGLIGGPICYVPGDDYDDPNAPVLHARTHGTSAHEILQITTRITSGQGFAPEELRVLVCYDN